MGFCALFQPLKDIAVLGGITARFECIVQCDPYPYIEWYKSDTDEPLRSGYGKYYIEFRNGVCRLTIPEAISSMCWVGWMAIWSGWPVLEWTIDVRFPLQAMLVFICAQLRIIWARWSHRPNSPSTWTTGISANNRPIIYTQYDYIVAFACVICVVFAATTTEPNYSDADKLLPSTSGSFWFAAAFYWVMKRLSAKKCAV